MSDLKTDLTSSLREITQYCHDSVKGFNDAAQSVKDDSPGLAQTWTNRAGARKDFEDKLSERLRCIGESGEDSGSARGAIHRGLLKLKDFFTSDDVQPVIDECVRGESELAEAIDEALAETTLDGATRSLLSELKLHVNASIAELKSLHTTS